MWEVHGFNQQEGLWEKWIVGCSAGHMMQAHIPHTVLGNRAHWGCSYKRQPRFVAIKPPHRIPSLLHTLCMDVGWTAHAGKGSGIGRPHTLLRLTSSPLRRGMTAPAISVFQQLQCLHSLLQLQHQCVLLQLQSLLLLPLQWVLLAAAAALSHLRATQVSNADRGLLPAPRHLEAVARHL
jgi:hypothetical protein